MKKKNKRDVGGKVIDDKDFNHKPPGSVRVIRRKPRVGLNESTSSEAVKALPRDLYAHPTQGPPHYRTAFFKHKVDNAAAKRKVYRRQLVGHYDKPVNHSQYRNRDKKYPLDDFSGGLGM